MREINIPSSSISKIEILPISRTDVPSFDFKRFVKDRRAFEAFITSHLQTLKVDSPKEVSELLKKGSENFFFSRFFEKTPVTSTLIYKTLENPSAFAKFSSMFLAFNKIAIFSILMIFTIIFSHFLGEFKFKYDVLSLPRILFGLFRFGFINLFRLSAFTALFATHLSEIFSLYKESLLSHQDLYPISSFFINLIG